MGYGAIHQQFARTRSRQRLGQPRRPAVWLAICLLTGIVIERLLQLGLLFWGAGLLCLLLCGCFSWGVQSGWLRFRSPHRAGTSGACATQLQDQSGLRSHPRSDAWGTVSILLLWVLLGGFRLHLETPRSIQDREPFAVLEPRTVRVVGVVLSPVEIRKAEQGPQIPAWLEVDSSRTRIACQELISAQSSLQVHEELRLESTGHLVHIRPGDRVEILGQLSMSVPATTTTAANFGRTHGRSFSREQELPVLRVSHPQAVRLLESGERWEWQLARFRERLRRTVQMQFVHHLSSESAILASALLLGDRSQLSNDMRTRFAESGTIHLLAISGLHVGILAGLVLLVCRLLNLSESQTTLALLLFVGGFTWLTDHRPPVIRATILIFVLLLGRLQSRRGDGFNALAVAACLIALWRPFDLFEVGTQLSFLAVGAIIWTTTHLQNWRPRPVQTDLELTLTERLAHSGRSLGEKFLKAYVITTVIWLSTLPLTISHFHLVAPVGIFLNLVLVPWLGLMLIWGFLMFLAALICPPLVMWCAIPFDWSLQVLSGTVSWAQQLPGGHYYSTGPPHWWVLGFYLALPLAWGIMQAGSSIRWAWRSLVVWSLLGVFLGCVPPASTGLKFTMLPVGHGLATVLRLPSGETILYDAGTLGDGNRATRAVSQYLWESGIERLDAIVISHPDHDHYSGLFGLLDRFSVGTIFVHRTFLDFNQRHVAQICEEAIRRGIPIRLLSKGDRFVPAFPTSEHTTRYFAEHLAHASPDVNERIPIAGSRIEQVRQNARSFLDRRFGSSHRHNTAQQVELEILHPDQNFHSTSDNANSVVLSITYAGQKLLLTGDLEKEGLELLMATASGPFPVVLAPHHGSRNSRPEVVAAWASAEYLLVSTSDRKVQPWLSELLINNRQTHESNSVLISPLKPAVKHASVTFAQRSTDAPPENRLPAVYSTASSGRVEVFVSPQGVIRVTPQWKPAVH